MLREHLAACRASEARAQQALTRQRPDGCRCESRGLRAGRLLTGARPAACAAGGRVARWKPALEEILGLTPSEADVLALVARGYTNREIATTLVISVKTASVHVSHILHKLDAPSRRDAAAARRRDHLAGC